MDSFLVRERDEAEVVVPGTVREPFGVVMVRTDEKYSVHREDAFSSR
jgi:hypothetical protein